MRAGKILTSRMCRWAARFGRSNCWRSSSWSLAQDDWQSEVAPELSGGRVAKVRFARKRLFISELPIGEEWRKSQPPPQIMSTIAARDFSSVRKQEQQSQEFSS